MWAPCRWSASASFSEGPGWPRPAPGPRRQPRSVAISGGVVRRPCGAGMGPAPDLSPEVSGTMRFMILVIPKAYEKAGADYVPPVELIAKMTKYNESLAKAGIVLAWDGLHPPVKGTRVKFAGGKPKTIDRPVTESKEPISGKMPGRVDGRETTRAGAPHARLSL